MTIKHAIPVYLTIGALSVFQVSQLSAATAQTKARVLYAGTYGNGDVFIGLSAQLSEPGCPQDRIDIPQSHPRARDILATAYAAMASGKFVNVYTQGCYGNFPTIDQSRNSYFFIDDRS